MLNWYDDRECVQVGADKDGRIVGLVQEEGPGAFAAAYYEGNALGRYVSAEHAKQAVESRYKNILGVANDPV